MGKAVEVQGETLVDCGTDNLCHVEDRLLAGLETLSLQGLQHHDSPSQYSVDKVRPTMRAALPRPNLHRHTYQRGMSLIFALVALVVLMLGALALVRNVDTATQLLGNLGFKQETTASSEQASRQALASLNTNALALNIDVNAEGYYASNQEYQADGTTARDPIDVTGNQLAGNTHRQLIDWDNNSCARLLQAAIRPAPSAPKRPTRSMAILPAVILRLCNKSGDRAPAASTAQCPWTPPRPRRTNEAKSTTHNNQLDRSQPKPSTGFWFESKVLETTPSVSLKPSCTSDEGVSP